MGNVVWKNNQKKKRSAGDNGSDVFKGRRNRGRIPSRESVNISQSCPFLPGMVRNPSMPYLPKVSLSSSDITSGDTNKEIISPSSNDDLTFDASLSPEDPVKKSEYAHEHNEKVHEHYEQEWSIPDLVNDFSDLDEIPPEMRNDILSSAKREAWWAYPEFFYDFCLIASDDDYEVADNLRKKLCAKFNLTGCMLYDEDNFRLGYEMFDLYERMMGRSTKIFFYISDNFNDNNFCRRIQSGAVFQGLMSLAKGQREKCVPVLPKGLCSVHLSLSGIGGLEIPKEKITEHRIKITFHEQVRKSRLTFEKANSEKRKSYFLDCLKLEVKSYVEEKGKENLARGSDKSKVFEASSSKYKTANAIISQNHTNTSSPVTVNDIQKILEISTSASVVSNSEVSITAKKAHIGNNITVIINSPSQEDALQSSSSDSDLSSI